jgi:hypothetical protein
MHLKFFDGFEWTCKLTKYGKGIEYGVFSVGVPCQAAVVTSILQKTQDNYPENNIIPTSKQKKLMRSSRVVRASDCHCQRRNSPWFNLCILRHRGMEQLNKQNRGQNGRFMHFAYETRISKKSQAFLREFTPQQLTFIMATRRGIIL